MRMRAPGAGGVNRGSKECRLMLVMHAKKEVDHLSGTHWQTGGFTCFVKVNYGQQRAYHDVEGADGKKEGRGLHCLSNA